MQPLFAFGRETEQPCVLVGRWVDCDDVRSVNVDLAEDLRQRLFAQLIRYAGIAPERPEVRQDTVGSPQPELIGLDSLTDCRAIQSTPRPGERIERELAGCQPRLELPSFDCDRLGNLGPEAPPTHHAWP
jgi:hypothetical protein